MNRYNFYLVIFLTAISIEFKSATKHKGCYMPDGCEWDKTDEHVNKTERHMDCRNLYAKFDTQMIGNNSFICTPNFQKALFVKIHINRYDLSRKSILNNSFQLSNISKFIDVRSLLITPFLPTFGIYNLKGIQADFMLGDNIQLPKTLLFYNSDFSFYTREGSLIRTCEEYNKSASKAPRNLFWAASANVFSPTSILYLFNCRYKKPICPLLFQNARLMKGKIFSMIR